MLVDSGYFEGPSDIVADNVEALPASPEEGQMVYLLQVDGANQPGLFIYLNSQWNALSTGDPL